MTYRKLSYSMRHSLRKPPVTDRQSLAVRDLRR